MAGGVLSVSVPVFELGICGQTFHNGEFSALAVGLQGNYEGLGFSMPSMH